MWVEMELYELKRPHRERCGDNEKTGVPGKEFSQMKMADINFSNQARCDPV